MADSTRGSTLIVLILLYLVSVDSAMFYFQWKPVRSTGNDIENANPIEPIGKVRINVDETVEISPLFPDGVGGTYFNSVDVLTAEVIEDSIGITCFFYSADSFVSPLFDTDKPLELPYFISAGWLYYFALPKAQRQILVLAEYGESSVQPFVVDLIMGFGYRSWPITDNGIGVEQKNGLAGYIRSAAIIASPEPDTLCYFDVDPSENSEGRNFSMSFSQNRPLRSSEFGVKGIHCKSEMSYDSNYRSRNWNLHNWNDDLFSNSD